MHGYSMRWFWLSHVGERSLHELTKQHRSVAPRTQRESESDTGSFGVPSVVLAGPFLPALAQRASFSNGHGIDGEFLEVSHKTAARSLAGQAGDGFHVHEATVA